MMKRYLPKDETAIKRYIRYGLGVVFIVLLLLFIAWIGLFWLILLPLILDYYFLRFINWEYFTNHPNKSIRTIGTIGSDVVFVLVAVTILQLYFFQNFKIPTASLEKTLLRGDYLVVNKFSYGVRKPMTPLSLPIFHNQILGSESYLDWIGLDYERIEGLGKVEHNDLVVFNFPAGDTVATKVTNPDYHTLCYQYGRARVNSDKRTFGNIVARPVDKRDYYVKRCIALPGDTLQIINTQVYLNGKAVKNPKELQFNYQVETTGISLSKSLLDDLGINYSDIETVRAGVFRLPLTEVMKNKLLQEPNVKAIHLVPDLPEMTDFYYPLASGFGWSRDNYGPLYVPKKGDVLPLNEDNIKKYRRCIEAYEGHSLVYNQSSSSYLIDGKLADSYIFEMDYYFMMGDNRHNSADSRSWGFVPEDHIAGKPVFIFWSRNEEKGWFDGGIRWSRIFRTIKQEFVN